MPVVLHGTLDLGVLEVALEHILGIPEPPEVVACLKEGGPHVFLRLEHLPVLQALVPVPAGVWQAKVWLDLLGLRLIAVIDLPEVLGEVLHLLHLAVHLPDEGGDLTLNLRRDLRDLEIGGVLLLHDRADLLLKLLPLQFLRVFDVEPLAHGLRRYLLEASIARVVLEYVVGEEVGEELELLLEEGVEVLVLGLLCVLVIRRCLVVILHNRIDVSILIRLQRGKKGLPGTLTTWGLLRIEMGVCSVP